MTVLELNGTPVTNFSNPDRRVIWSKRDIWGNVVNGSLRSIAHLDQTDQRARAEFGYGVEVIQDAYNVGVSASAGTHDGDAVYDTFIPNVDWWVQQRFFREEGWAAWYRYPPAFSRHIHMISLGYRASVGVYVPGQVRDYRAWRSGLSGHVTDNTWHPANIDATIFNYARWVEHLEDNMPLNDADKRFVNTAVEKAASEAAANAADMALKRFLNTEVADGVSVRAAIRKAADTKAISMEVRRMLREDGTTE